MSDPLVIKYDDIMSIQIIDKLDLYCGYATVVINDTDVGLKFKEDDAMEIRDHWVDWILNADNYITFHTGLCRLPFNKNEHCTCMDKVEKVSLMDKIKKFFSFKYNIGNKNTPKRDVSYIGGATYFDKKQQMKLGLKQLNDFLKGDNNETK